MTRLFLSRRLKVARARWRREERGVSAVVLSLCVCIVMVPLGAVAVDLGVQRVAGQDMQAVADVVALDLARDLDPAKKASEYDLAALTNKARDRAAAQGSIGTNTRFLVQVGELDPPKYGSADYFIPLTGHKAATAVRVVATTDVSFGLAGALPKGGIASSSATRYAIAGQRTPLVCFSAGTQAMTLDSTKSALAPLLKNILQVKFGVVSYDGIVALKDVSIPVAELMLKLGVGTTDAMATTQISLRDLILASADVLRQSGGIATASFLESLQLAAPGEMFPFGDILGLDAGTSVAGLGASLNLLDLFGAAVFAANGDSAINAGIPGLASLRMIQRPRTRCGTTGAEARQAQFELKLSAPVPLTAALSALGITSNDNKAELTVRVGDGRVWLAAEPTCAPERVTLNAGTAGGSLAGTVLLYLTIGKFLDILGSIVPALLWNLTIKPALLLTGLSKVGLKVDVGGSVAATSATTTVTYSPPPAELPSVTVPASGLGQAIKMNATDVHLVNEGGLLGIIAAFVDPLSGILLNGVVKTALDLVSETVSPILNAVLAFIGVTVGVVDIDMRSRPVCRGVRLLG